jgi:hypothetical protein
LLKYDYDYKGIHNTWTNRTQEAFEQQTEQNGWNPLRLRRRRQQVQEPAISKMPRRGSTGKLAAVDSSHSMTSRNSRENRRGGRRNSKSIKADNKKVPLRSQKLIRRASTGAVRLAEEPVVTIFWNPAREETLASSMHEDPAEAIQTRDPPDARERGIVPRRASTGWVRLTQEPTIWMYAREDHEIAQAEIRKEPEKVQEIVRVDDPSTEKAESSSMGLYKAKLRRNEHSVMPVSRTRPSAADAGQSIPEDNDSGIELHQEWGKTTHNDKGTAPPRMVVRRKSTGAVPLADEPDSRLHRKLKMRQDHKRRSSIVRERGACVPKNTGPRRKATLLGLLDPASSMADNPDDPTSWLAGGSTHIFTICPYKKPKSKKNKKKKKKSKSKDEEDDELDVAAQHFSMRPGGNRGMSFMDKPQEGSDSDSEPDASQFNLRPGGTRGMSFMDKPQEGSDSDSEPDASQFNLRPGGTRGMSFMDKPQEGSDSDSEPDASHFNMRPGCMRGMSFIDRSDVIQTNDDETTRKDAGHAVGAATSSDDDDGKFMAVLPANSKSAPKKKKKKKRYLLPPAEEPNQDSVSSSNGNAWEFTISAPARVVRTYFDSDDEEHRTMELLNESEHLPERPPLTKVTRNIKPRGVASARPVATAQDDDEDDSSTSSSSSSSSSSNSSMDSFGGESNNKSQAMAEGRSMRPGVTRGLSFDDANDVKEGDIAHDRTERTEMPNPDNDDDDDDASSSSSSSDSFVETLRPGVTRGLTFEDDSDLIDALKELDTEKDDEKEAAPTTSEQSGPRRRIKRRPSMESDLEILLALEKLVKEDDGEKSIDTTSYKQVQGHLTAKMIKSATNHTREEKEKKKKKKKDKEKRKEKKKKEKKKRKKQAKDAIPSDNADPFAVMDMTDRPSTEDRKKAKKRRDKRRSHGDASEKNKSSSELQLEKEKDPEPKRKKSTKKESSRSKEASQNES